MPPDTKIPRTREAWSNVGWVLTSASHGFDKNGLYLLRGGVVVAGLSQSLPSSNSWSGFSNMAKILVQVFYEDGSHSSPLSLALATNPSNRKEKELERILGGHQGKQLEGIVGVRFAKSAMPKVSTYYLCLTGLVEAVVVSNKVMDYRSYTPKNVGAIIQK